MSFIGKKFAFLYMRIMGLIESISPKYEIVQLIILMSNDFSHISAVIIVRERLECRTGEFIVGRLKSEKKCKEINV